MESLLNISDSDLNELNSLFEKLLEAQGYQNPENFSREEFLVIRSSDPEGDYYRSKDHVA